MSRFDYLASRELEAQDAPFYALIMAAMRRADTDNIRLLRVAFPDTWTELEARYNAPGGYLPGEMPDDIPVRQCGSAVIHTDHLWRDGPDADFYCYGFEW